MATHNNYNVWYIWCRHAAKTTNDASKRSKGKETEVADDKKTQENSSHFYEEIQQCPPKSSKTTNGSHKGDDKAKDEVIFDRFLPPAYRTSATSSNDNSTFTGRRSNDYYIEEDIGLSQDLKNTGEKCQKDKDLKSNQTYSQLIHCNDQ